jgi:hypothetical protein
MRTFAASLRVGVLVSCFALVDTANSPAQAACADTVPLMTIKIFNRDPNTYIFPVLTMGLDPGGDVWLQSCFKVPANEIGQKNYPRTLAYRIYAFPQGGIKPCKNCKGRRQHHPDASLVYKGGDDRHPQSAQPIR